MKFKSRVRIICSAIALVPLILSYIFFTNLRLKDIDEVIGNDLKETAFVVANTPLVQQKLYDRENDRTIQDYVKEYTESFNNVDIIVVGDMKEVKYSHLDQSQIGQKYVNPDNEKVVKTGESYFSTMEGSVGVTYRYFKPIFYEGKQVGFVMVGKYLSDMEKMSKNTVLAYSGVLFLVVFVTIVLAEYFARKIKDYTLGLEPEEIARLYKEKRIILDTITNAVIAIDKDDKVMERNIECIKVFSDKEVEVIVDKLKDNIKNRKSIKMKEYIINDKKVFLTLSFIENNERYLGSVISVVSGEKINEVAREITGVDEMLKNIRANIHEFKNKLHVILGLINVEEYDEAKKYIHKCQADVEGEKIKILNIKDNLIGAMILSKKLIAKERNIDFEIAEDTFLLEKHGRITSMDIIIILGNLIENAFEVFDSESENKYVELFTREDEHTVYLEVVDNGRHIDKDIKENIFECGVSSKGENRGIGLSTLKGRVELYDGSIEIIENKNDKKFIIILKKDGLTYEESSNS